MKCSQQIVARQTWGVWDSRVILRKDKDGINIPWWEWEDGIVIWFLKIFRDKCQF